MGLEWINYVFLLNHNVILLQDHEDELKWTYNKSASTLSTKLGYDDLIAQDIFGDKHRWWSLIWKLLCPLKVGIFNCLSLSNTILIGYNGQKIS